LALFCATSESRGQTTPMHYDVCISYAGEQRPYARRLATAFKKAGIYTFFDEFEQARLWGTFLLDELGKIYFAEAYFCVVLFSRSYFQKMYPDRERKSALLQQAEGNPEYILPIKLDDVDIPVSLRGIAHLDGKKTAISRIVSLLQAKLESNTNRVKDDVTRAMRREQYEQAAQHAIGYLKKMKYTPGHDVDPKYGAVIGLFAYNLVKIATRSWMRRSSTHRIG
jgi:hypothetical protein